MKRWLVFDDEHQFWGIISEKETLKLFKKQRHMDRFRIEKVDLDDETLAPALASLDEDYYRADVYYGQVMTQGEIDAMDGMASQLNYEVSNVIGKFLKDFLPYIKLTDEEETLVRGLIAHMYHTLKNYDEMIESDGYLDGEEDVFDYEYIARITTAYFGGKEDEPT